MLSKPIASGMMLTALILVGGGALLQSDSGGEVARTAVVLPEAEDEAAPEQAASAPSRVVDSAGFPVVPNAEVAAAPKPTVTVNGRPINGESTAAPAEPKPEAVAATPPASTPAPAAPEAREQEEVAVIVPPRPIPRPEGLSVPRQEPAIDYDALAAIAYGQDEAIVPPAPVPGAGEWLPNAQPEAYGPVIEDTPYEPYDPRREGLVAVVGPDGEPIWIYEEQMRGNSMPNSDVTFETRRVQSHPYGFVYDDYGW